ncbi:hypothetical protein [Hyphococcus sp.]|uniref:hypothetical protein n=1 Tax=Hyphococcus sp. TaxID=2038636 RepID=UPI0035C6A12E
MTGPEFGKRKPDTPKPATDVAKDPLASVADLPLPEKIAALWPLIFIFVGGAIGGACGGGAALINIRIMHGSLPAPAKYVLALLTGIGALLLYFLIVIGLALAFPDIFARQG